MYEPGFGKKLFLSKVPEKNKHPPEVGQLRSFQLTLEEAHKARCRQQILVA
jgi:hypothetical protein